jgi:hypothetical protein
MENPYCPNILISFHFLHLSVKKMEYILAFSKIYLHSKHFSFLSFPLFIYLKNKHFHPFSDGVLPKGI